MSIGQLGHDFHALLQEVLARDMLVDKLRSLLDSEVSQAIFLELRDTSIDIGKIRNTLTDLEYSTKGMHSTVLEIQDDLQRESRI